MASRGRFSRGSSAIGALGSRGVSPPEPDHLLFLFRAVLVFVLGAVLGSFFNVVIWRVPRRFSIVLPASHCPTCGATLRWWDNIPLVSLLMLGRRCRQCEAPISWRYFLVELATALLMLAVFLRLGWTPTTFVYGVFVSLLLIATFTDIDHWIIPDGVSVGGLVFGLTAATAGRWLPGHLPSTEWPHWGGAWWQGVANAALGAAVGWGVLKSIAVMGRLAFRREAMGGGDIVLMAMFGAFLGWQGVVATLLMSCVMGVVIGGTLLIFDKLREHRAGGPLPPPPRDLPEAIDPSSPAGFGQAVAHFDLHRKERAVSTHLPFGPYLCLAALVTLLAWPQVKAALVLLYGGPWALGG